MQDSLAATQIALRVLTAITENRLPDPGDVVALHSYAGAQPEGIDLDELACTVIQQAMNRRDEGRAAGRGSD
jgi:hypothetical protein